MSRLAYECRVCGLVVEGRENALGVVIPYDKAASPASGEGSRSDPLASMCGQCATDDPNILRRIIAQFAIEGFRPPDSEANPQGEPEE